MKRAYEKPVEGPPAKRFSADLGVPRTRYAFKVLCTEALTSFILGARGAVKDAIQQDSNAKLVFSNKGDHFPQTPLRVLGVYSDEPQSIVRALELTVEKFVKLAEDELTRPPPGGPELLGEEPGEYVFRFLLSRDTANLFFGVDGSNAREIWQDTGAKVSCDGDDVLDHCVVRAAGAPEALLCCLERANEYVQCDSGSEEFQRYLGLVNFAEATARDSERGAGGRSNGRREDLRDVRGDGRGDGHRDGARDGFRDGHRDGFRDDYRPSSGDGRRASSRDAHADFHRDGRAEGYRDGRAEGPRDFQRDSRREGRGEGRDGRENGHHDGRGDGHRGSHSGRGAPSEGGHSRWSDGGRSRGHAPAPELSSTVRAGLDGLHEAIASMPRGTPELSHCLHCELPASLVGALVGRSGEFIRRVQDESGAKVDIERSGQGDMRHMRCTGTLLGVYSAHAAMLQRVQDLLVRNAERPYVPASRRDGGGGRGEGAGDGPGPKAESRR